MGSKKKAGPRRNTILRIPEKARPKTISELGEFSGVARKETMEVLKYVQWCFEQDPVGMFKLFTRGL